MKYIKEHWPVLLYIIAVLVSIIQWVVNASSDTGGSVIFYIMVFCILLPMCAFISSVWYGYRLRNKTKWLIPLACICPIIIITFVMGSFKFWENYLVMILSVVVALVGMLIGSALWKTRKTESAD